MKTTRYTVDLDPTFDTALATLASSKGTTKAEIIKRALATYNYLSSQTMPNASTKVSITNAEDQVIKDVVLP